MSRNFVISNNANEPASGMQANGFVSIRHEQRVHAMERKQWLKLNGKPIALGMLILLALGFTGYIEKQSLDLGAVISACEDSAAVTSRKLEAKCGKLIDSVQSSGKYEVLSDGRGEFWVEGTNRD